MSHWYVRVASAIIGIFIFIVLSPLLVYDVYLDWKENKDGGA